jgi:Zn-finger nucleic acid-binding protein
MNCPVCNVALTIADRQGVEIDYCPKCRGVWLDRGELDKLIERAAADRVDRRDQSQHEYYPEKYDDQHRHGPHGRKRKSLLGEIFDFD